MKRRTVMPMAILALLLVAACGGTQGSGNSSDPPEGSNASKPTTDAEAPAESSQAFGDTYSYEDGLSVTISQPKKYKPTPNSSLVKLSNWPNYVVFEVTLVNGTKQRFDPTGWTTTLQSKDKEGEEVFDDGIAAPETTLLPGRQAKFKISYGVLDPSDLVMDVDADFEHPTLTYALTD